MTRNLVRPEGRARFLFRPELTSMGQEMGGGQVVS